MIIWDFNGILIAVIGALVSIVVARIQASNKTKEVINNGFGKEVRARIAELQNTADLQAARLDGYTVVTLERDDLQRHLNDLQREIRQCPCEECPLRKAMAIGS